jgi:hypothetical protein
MKLEKFIQKYQILIAVAVIAGVLYYVSTNTQIIQNYINTPESSNTPVDQNQNINVYVPTAAPDSLSPTSLMIVVSPSSANMGNTFTGAVTSNGYKYPITIHAKHLGSNEEQSFGALINDVGTYYHAQTLSLAGKWQFWATTSSTTSNVASCTVIGITIFSNRTTFSKSLSPSGVFKIYSSSSGNCQVIANDPIHSISYPLTNCVINSGGYGEILLDFSSLVEGSYQIDGIVNGLKASDYGGALTIQVSR